MIQRAFEWAWQRFRPFGGWLSLILLFGIVASLAASVIAVDWVPEIAIVAYAVTGGLLLGALVARGSLRASYAWLLTLAYAIIFSLLYAGRLVPPLTLLAAGAGGTYFRQQSALLLDRLAGWYIAVSAGETSEETIVFTLLVGTVAWLLAALAAWTTYRMRRPLVALSVLGLAIAGNAYFAGDDAPIWLLSIFVGLAAVLTAVVHYANQESVWARERVDYSREIRLELLAAAGGLAILLTTLALFVPAVRWRAIADLFAETEAVQQAEQTLERTLGGVRQPRQEEPLERVGPGVLPRSFLLGNAPELYETEVMTATLRPQVPNAVHWRAASYDVYTGRGWALSEEREERIPAGAALPQPEIAAATTLSQTVDWFFDTRTIRYTMGLPVSFDEPVTVYWRGVSDFSRAVGEDTAYRVVTVLPPADPALLRQATLDAIPDVIRARYTALPEGIPERVTGLAQEIAGDLNTPYDQARGLEAFLRQYPYSLDVTLPPQGRDPVDFFLFDLQRGYCDYYATSMAVMARSLGLPARLATGYLAQAPDADGVQTIYQINAHAWAEIYFAGFGWIEFEPTASFATASQVAEADDVAPAATAEPTPAPPPIPERISANPSPLWATLLLPLAFMLWWLWRRRNERDLRADPVLWTYDRLLRGARRLGLATPASQTPAEFQASFVARLERWQGVRYLGPMVSALREPIERLTSLFVTRQYGGRRVAASEAERIWRHLAPRLRLLRLFSFLGTNGSEE